MGSFATNILRAVKWGALRSLSSVWSSGSLQACSRESNGIEEHPRHGASKTYVEGLAVERIPTCITPQICREFMAVLTRAAIGPRSFSVEEALIGDDFDFFNDERPHQALGYSVPAVYFSSLSESEQKPA